jgi:adenylylsulfate kinase
MKRTSQRLAAVEDNRPPRIRYSSKLEGECGPRRSVLAQAGPHEPSRVQPAVLWFTGLSGSGKSTIAKKVVNRLKELGADVEHLDGDTMRRIFPNTGFTKKDRDEHIKRVGFLAGMLEKHGVFVVASFVSPYRKSRNAVRNLCRNFIEVHVSTPLEECERRDTKGLYAKARRGKINNFTGISDPYEPPVSPALSLPTNKISVDESVNRILNLLLAKGIFPVGQDSRKRTG